MSNDAERSREETGSGRSRPAGQPDPPVQQSAGSTRSADAVDVVGLFYLLWGHAWQIILSLIGGAALTFAVTYFLITPMYQASASIYIVSASNDSVINLTDLQIGDSLASDYEKLLVIRPLLQDVIDNLGLDLDYTELRELIEVTNEEDTRILTITVTCDDPYAAADIANELVEQACIYLPQIMESDEPNLVESAIVPEKKYSPSYTRNTLLGGLAGAALCCLILIIRFMTDDTLATQEEIERYFGVMPLAVVPEGASGEKTGKKGKKRRHRGK